MEDRFKFRFYDKNKKIMIDEDADHDLLVSVYGRDEWWWCIEASFPTMLSYFDSDDDVKDEKDFAIMQCTGLYDKNGTLIYEGDLIRYTEYELDEVEPEWEYTEIVWGGSHYYPAFDLKVHDFDCNGLSYIFNEGWTIEVVGNIYEAQKIIEEVKNE